MKLFLLTLIVLSTTTVAHGKVTKLFDIAPFAAQSNGEVVYSQENDLILETNVLTKNQRSYKCDFGLGAAANERLNVHHLDLNKMVIIKETLEIGGWEKEAWGINLQNGECKSIDIDVIGENTFQYSFSQNRSVELPSLNLKVKAPFLFNSNGNECYGIKTVDLLTNKESRFKWDMFCGVSYGVNLLGIQNNSNALLLHNTGKKSYNLYVGIDNFMTEQTFKMIDSIDIDSHALNFMRIENHPNKILLLTFRSLGGYYQNRDRGVYILDL